MSDVYKNQRINAVELTRLCRDDKSRLLESQWALHLLLLLRLHRRQPTLDVVELRVRRRWHVQIERPVVRARPLRRRHRRRGAAGEAPVVVAPLVPPQRLPRGKRLQAHRTPVHPGTDEGRASRGRARGRGFLDAAAGLPVAGLVPAQGLVRPECLPADGTPVLELRRRCRVGGQRRQAMSAGPSSTSEHDEAERQILFLRRRMVEEALGPLPLRPPHDVRQLLVARLVAQQWDRSRYRRLQRLDRHRVVPSRIKIYMKNARMQSWA
ncbi:unnamed protein product [Musa acuminata subsp. malaccensis]|uniref:(wild Malaysian banana) hypothetical protein n=1 Tax=Musa acuminata subsp. malaccensis TaxID=214687 RepID=A0A8D6ZVJ5_MUSAM|nr:unnamed protein product [Musa acuminata subsp. malaccensis]